MKEKIVWLVMMLCFSVVSYGQQTVIEGTVRDSVTGEVLPYASLMLEGTSAGTRTGDDGRFRLATSVSVNRLQVSYLGYDTRNITVQLGKINRIDIALIPSGVTLSDIVVKPKRERYRRKDNPAVRFARQVIDRRESNDPRNQDYFSYDQYEKMVFAMNDYKPKPKKSGENRKI